MTFTGLFRFVVVPSPSCPNLFDPHVQREPSDLIAAEWKPYSETAATPSMTLSGQVRPMVVPLPSWLALFHPHIQRLPSDLIAAEWSVPIENVAGVLARSSLPTLPSLAPYLT